MWKSIWLILILGGVGYAYYTGWNPLAGGLPVADCSSALQAGGAAAVRQIEHMPQVIQDMSNISGASAANMQAARDATRRVAGGGRK